MFDIMLKFTNTNLKFPITQFCILFYINSLHIINNLIKAILNLKNFTSNYISSVTNLIVEMFTSTNSY